MASSSSAWRAYRRGPGRGRGVVVIGHSQGTFLLRRLLAEELDGRRAARRRLVSALLLGGNTTVRKGRDRGGDFERIRACRSRRQLGCVVAYSIFNAPVPEAAIFGRTSAPRLEILCTNPAALGGGTGRLDPVYPRRRFASSVIGAVTNQTLEPLSRPATPWAAFPDSYRGRCSKADGASVLQVSPRRGAFELSASPTPEWGLHLGDVNLALGNLTELVRRQIRGWAAKRR